MNQPNSAVGDVQAQLVLTPTAARFVLFRAATATGAGPLLTEPGEHLLPVSTANPLGVGTTHTIAIGWDAAAHRVTFQLDDAPPVVVDPTTADDPFMAIAAPVAAARPRVESTTLVAVSAVGAATGAPGTSSGTFRLNNLLVSP